MIRTSLTVIAATAALAAPAHAQAHAAKIIPSDASFVLKPHTTQTYSMHVKGLGQKRNVLGSCWGAEILGPGVNYPVGQPDFPAAGDPLYPVTATNFFDGVRCQKMHWADAAGPQVSTGQRAATKKRLARRLAHAPFRVEAGFRTVGLRSTLIVRVGTGALKGRTVLRLHARVEREG